MNLPTIETALQDYYTFNLEGSIRRLQEDVINQDYFNAGISLTELDFNIVRKDSFKEDVDFQLLLHLMEITQNISLNLSKEDAPYKSIFIREFKYFKDVIRSRFISLMRAKGLHLRSEIILNTPLGSLEGTVLTYYDSAYTCIKDFNAHDSLNAFTIPFQKANDWLEQGILQIVPEYTNNPEKQTDESIVEA